MVAAILRNMQSCAMDLEYFPFIFTGINQEQPNLELSKVLVYHTDGNKRSIDARTYAIIEHSGLEKNMRSTMCAV